MVLAQQDLGKRGCVEGTPASCCAVPHSPLLPSSASQTPVSLRPSLGDPLKVWPAPFLEVLTCLGAQETVFACAAP